MSVRILVGDVRSRLADLPDESVHCVVTSPPYWGLRDYGMAGQVGSEATWPEFVEAMVAVFRAVRRVLRKDGTLWLNLGDCYATGGGKVGRHPGGGKQGENWGARGHVTQPNRMPQPELKAKDLVGMPWRVALALQADGWWLRQALPWVKRNPMPESTDDRPTTAVEYVFLLTRAERYFYDYAAVQRPASEETHPRLRRNGTAAGSERANGGTRAHRPMKAVRGKSTYGRHTLDEALPAGQRRLGGERTVAEAGSGIKNNDSMDAALAVMPEKRAFRNSDLFFDSLSRPLGAITGTDGEMIALDVPSRGFREAHFATFPPALVEPLILAATSEKGVCSICGAPWMRETEHARVADRAGRVQGRSGDSIAAAHGADGRAGNRCSVATRTLGWAPSCDHGGEPVLATVLDPFFGAGTTGLVADRLGRNCIGIELNPEYAAMAERRIKGDAPLFAETSAA